MSKEGMSKDETRDTGLDVGAREETPGAVSNFLQVMTTAGSRAEADRIAAVLVGQRLAACVQVLGPLTSSYWWEGRVETAEEWLCLVKTTSERYAGLEAAIREAHSYEVPEILAVPVAAGSEPYLRWLAAAVTDPSG